MWLTVLSSGNSKPCLPKDVVQYAGSHTRDAFVHFSRNNKFHIASWYCCIIMVCLNHEPCPCFVFMGFIEFGKASNTGKLVALNLTESKLLVLGQPDSGEAAAIDELRAQSPNSCILFPSKTAISVTMVE